MSVSYEQRTVADVIVYRLQARGVSRVYGYSGDGINGVLDAIRRSDGRLSFVQARHEKSAAFMVAGEAKYARLLEAYVEIEQHLTTEREEER